jgi:hypothetical protein
VVAEEGQAQVQGVEGDDLNGEESQGRKKKIIKKEEEGEDEEGS